METTNETEPTVELTEDMFPMHRAGLGQGHWISVLDVAQHDEGGIIMIQHRYGSARIELPSDRLRALAADLLKAADLLDGVTEKAS